MQIPMEALSLAMPRTGSGEITRLRAPAVRDDFLFGKIMEAARTGSEPVSPKETKETAEFRSPDTMAEGKKAVPFTAEKRSKYEDIAEAINDDDMSLAAGVIMGNQNKVVFILEGDKESGTQPDLAIAAVVEDTADYAYPVSAQEPEISLFTTGDNDAEAGAVQAGGGADADAVNTAYTGGAAETVYTTDFTDTMAETAALDTAAGIAYVKDEPTIQSYAGSAAVTDAGIKTVPEAENADSAVIEETGEVTARMPAIRTSERSEKQDGENGNNDPEPFNDGYLSPLENENDNIQVKGRKDKDYSKAEDAANDTVKNAELPASSMETPAAADIRPERFRADQQMSRAADAPVGSENLFDKMVSQIETSILDNVRTMTIQLKPEFLGKVAIELALDAAGLHVKINADDQGVKGMVNSQINSLIESLTNKGIEVVEVEVAYTGIDNGEFTDPRKNGAQQPDSPKRARRAEADPVPDDVTYYTVTPVEMMEYYVDAGVSSVEYRA